MDDKQIIDLYWQRNEEAIAATAEKYGNYCGSISGNILTDREDVEECVNDTWLRAWNAIPPHKPVRLRLFLGKITRELSINRSKALSAQKRGGRGYASVLDELEEFMVTDSDPVEQAVEAQVLGRQISEFLKKQPSKSADIFIRRYYHLCPIRQIADEFSISESKTKSLLYCFECAKNYMLILKARNCYEFRKTHRISGIH